MVSQGTGTRTELSGCECPHADTVVLDGARPGRAWPVDGRPALATPINVTTVRDPGLQDPDTVPPGGL